MEQQSSLSFSGSAAVSATIDRRLWVRRVCLMAATGRSLIPMNQIHWVGPAMDISPGGICLLLNRPFEVGTKLEIELPGGLLLQASVVHATAHSDGCWKIGCAFAQPLGQEEMGLLLSEGP